MLHPDTQLQWISPAIGWGVFATREIPRGTLTWVQDPFDRILSPAEVAALPRLLQLQADIYGFQDSAGDTVLCWDLGRYVNHHCRPNSIGGGAAFDIAVRTIPAGAQLTTDYAQLNLERPFRCLCGHRRCRGIIRPEDFEWLAPQWDARVAQAVRRAGVVEQPLWSLVEDPLGLLAIIAGEAPMPSVNVQRYRSSGSRHGHAAN